jgi:hypothetical protein
VPVGQPCWSPDGGWTVQVEGGRARRLVLTRCATGERIVGYSSHDDCCSDIAWARPHLLVFDDDYKAFTLDLAKGRASFVAGFSDIYASPDGTWIAGDRFAPPGEHQPAGVIELATGKCYAVPGEDDEIGSEWHTPFRTGFTRDDTTVVFEAGARGPIRFRISSLRSPCDSSLTRQP